MKVNELIEMLEDYSDLHGNAEIHFEKYDVGGDHEELSLNMITQRFDDKCLIEFD